MGIHKREFIDRYVTEYRIVRWNKSSWKFQDMYDYDRILMCFSSISVALHKKGALEEAGDYPTGELYIVKEIRSLLYDHEIEEGLEEESNGR